MKQSLFFALIPFLSSGAAIATPSEGGASHGGVAVVCRNSEGKITEAALLDLFEAANLNDRRLIPISVIDYAEVRGAIRAQTKRFPTFIAHLDQTLEDLKPRYRFLGAGVQLEITRDVFPTITKRGCQIEQLANFRKEGDILVDREIYDALSPVDRLGLALHEALYSLERKWVKATDSLRARALVGEFLSEGHDASVVNSILGTYEFGIPTPGIYYPSYEPSGACQVRLEIEENGLPSVTALTNCQTIIDALVVPTTGKMRMQITDGQKNAWEYRTSPSRLPSGGNGYSVLRMTFATRSSFYLKDIPMSWMGPNP